MLFHLFGSIRLCTQYLRWCSTEDDWLFKNPLRVLRETWILKITFSDHRRRAPGDVLKPYDMAERQGRSTFPNTSKLQYSLFLAFPSFRVHLRRFVFCSQEGSHPFFILDSGTFSFKNKCSPFVQLDSSILGLMNIVRMSM